MGCAARPSKPVWLGVAAGVAVALAGVAGANADEINSDWAESFKARTRISAARMQELGATQMLAFIKIEMPKGWKTYWKQPGESGLPPTFDWSGSVNVSEANVLFPVPQRIADKGGEVIGYTDEVIFPVEVTVADAAKAAELEVAVQFGMCKDICIPAEIKVSVDVPADGNGVITTEQIAALDAVPRAAAVAKPLDPVLKRTTLDVSGAKPRLVVEAAFPESADDADIFFVAPGGAYFPPARRVSAAGDVVTFEADLSDSVDLEAMKGSEILATLKSAKGHAETSFKLQ